MNAAVRLDTNAADGTATPLSVHGGLAIYADGLGTPLLLMPTPHACTSAPEISKPLAQVLLGLGHRVVTFDPPGAFQSSRPPTIGMPEMLECAAEALEVAGVAGSLPVCGHSMASVCAIGFALRYPERASRLLLVGTTTGPRAAVAHGGMPRCWPWWSSDFWRFVFRSLRLSVGLGNLYVQQQLCRQIVRASYYRTASQLAPTPDLSSRHLPASPRVMWARRISALDYALRLREIHVPTLICAGSHDPQTTPAANAVVASGISEATMVLFDESGHYPFIEERERFSEVISGFLADDVTRND